MQAVHVSTEHTAPFFAAARAASGTPRIGTFCARNQLDAMRPVCVESARLVAAHTTRRSQAGLRPRGRPLRTETRACAAAPAEPPARVSFFHRRSAIAAAAGAALLFARRALAEGGAPPRETATFAGGEHIFLENVFDNLRYAGVTDVVIGYVGEERVRAVRVTYSPAKLPYAKLLREYWKNVCPTQADGQFDKSGAAYGAAIWASTPEQRAAAESSRAALERSGVFGGPIVVPVLDGPPEASFDPAPESERGAGKRDPRRLEDLRKRTGRAAYYDSLWGLSTFCSGRVCGYVQFAKGCTGECLDVFPEYRNQENAFQS